MLAIEAELFRRGGGFEGGRAIGQHQKPTHQVAVVELSKQLLQRGRRWAEFKDQLQRTATGQPEAVSLIGTDTVADHFRRPLGQPAAAIGRGVTVDQVILDAAA